MDKNSKFPVDKIKVGGFEFDFKYMEQNEVDDTGSVGRFSSTFGYIKMGDEQTDCQAVDTMIHETIHAIEYVMAARPKADEEELYVDTMSSGWGMVIKDNPDMLLWMLYMYTKNKKILKLIEDMVNERDT